MRQQSTHIFDVLAIGVRHLASLTRTRAVKEPYLIGHALGVRSLRASSGALGREVSARRHAAAAQPQATRQTLSMLVPPG